MASREKVVVQLLRQLAEGSDFVEACRGCGVDETEGRALMGTAAERMQKSGGARRRAPKAPTLPLPPESSPYDAGATVIAHADGASRGNPGPASYGCVYLGEDGQPAFGEGATIGVATNNVAEYRGCLAALQRLASWGVRRAVLRLDSQLVVRQLEGEYRVKDATLKRWFTEVRRSAASLEHVRYEHVPRAENAMADQLANRALDASSS